MPEFVDFCASETGVEESLLNMQRNMDPRTHHRGLSPCDHRNPVSKSCPPFRRLHEMEQVWKCSWFKNRTVLVSTKSGKHSRGMIDRLILPRGSGTEAGVAVAS